ncbi:MAG TPA: hypothetical protein VF519_14605 [Mycobacteriales bacterium]|jgi:hypothetical protein
MRLVLRACAVAGSTALLCSLSPGTAGAASTGGGVVLANAAVALHTVDATLSYEAVPAPHGSLVEFNCKAVAAVDPASTGIDVCTVYGVSAIGSPNNVPGAVAVAAGVVFVPDRVVPYGCVGAHAQFAEGILGPLAITVPVRCAPLPLIAIDGV